MSRFVLAVAQKRIAKWVIWPLALLFSVGVWQCADHGKWSESAAFLLLLLYVGWIASTPALRKPLPQNEPGDLDDEETRELARVIVPVYYALVIASVVLTAALGFRWYWIIGIAVITWVSVQIAGSFAMVLASRGTNA
jgi:hypothetical protein